MTTLALHDIEPELLEELTRRAQRLGTTVEREALRVLREHLAQLVPAAAIPERRSAAASEPKLIDDSRFDKATGFWVFTGPIDEGLIPDHRELREMRLDSFVRAALGEDSD